ncbi:MAG: Mth938-like domain-containing protein [Gammaproteobacteria bacterium]|jgi:uncharacterized protein|nr:Mth938-like domain-containing protein [Gammaproteobacteria bacterium]
MKFAQDLPHEGYVITSYDSNSICINGKTFSSSLIVTAAQLETDWEIAAIESLQANHIDQLLSFNPELIIIGTGNSLVFPAVEVYSAIIKHGIGIEFMDTGAACRTYNILMGEGRDVVAGLIQNS